MERPSRPVEKRPEPSTRRFSRKASTWLRFGRCTGFSRRQRRRGSGARSYDAPASLQAVPLTAPIALTVFVYPAEEGLEQYLAGIHEEIPLGLPGAKRTASEPYSLTVGDRSYVGLRSRHTIPLPAPTEEQAVVSDTILLRVDRDGRSWFIKIRATFERSAADQVYEGTTAWLQSILAV